MFSQLFNWRTALATIAIAIVTGTVFYTNYISKKIAIDERKKDLLRVINETYNRGGKLMIPSFAVERAQEILYCIGEFLQEKNFL